MKKVGTLEELNVKPGDVVECVEWRGSSYTVGNKYHVVEGFGTSPYSIGTKDISGKWCIVSRAYDNPKLWRDMTDAEKGALLLAHHEGEVIEGRNKTWADDEWIVIRTPSWNHDSAYRVRPKPKVNVVKQGYKTNSSGKFVTTPSLDYATHVVTFNLIGGKPDCASIEMEPLE